MPRATSGAARHKRKVRLFKKAKGYRGARGSRYRTAKEAVLRAGVNAYRDRKLRKRDFRSLWIIRLNAACRQRDFRYALLINGLRRAGVVLNRKMLSEIAIHAPETFDRIVELAKQHVSKQAA